MKPITRYFILCGLAAFPGLLLLPRASAQTLATLRIVSYNIDCADEGSDDNITGPAHSLPTVVQAIGLHHLGSNAQPMDVMNVEELNSTTLSNFTAALNNIYGAGTYTFDPTTDPNTGGGPDGLIYNPSVVQVVSARVLPTGQTVLLQSNGAYAAAHFPGGGENGVTRAPMVYQLRPVGFGTSNDFYLYISHARSTSDDSQGDARYAEAQEVRSDAKYNLPAGSHILYAGDWNLFNGSGENAYKCLTGQTTSDGINWADDSSVWANLNQTQGYDPTSKTVPPTTTTWANVSTDNANYLYDDATYDMTSRIDIQLPNALMFGVYNSQGGVQLAPDTSDPYDTSDFPSSQYPYAFEVFGNNGTTPEGGVSTSSSNHSLDDLANTVPSAATVYYDLDEIVTGSTFTGSDHYPIVGDYHIVSAAPTAPFFATPTSATTNTVTAGNNITFTALAEGSGPITYGWYFNGVAQTSPSASAPFTLTNITTNQAGTYNVVASGTVSPPVTSANFVLIVNPPSAPYFITPTNATTNTVAAGNNITLTAQAGGSGPINYTWYFDGLQQTSASASASFTLTNVATNQAGTYNVVATGSLSPPATSANFVLIVNPSPLTNIAYLRSLLVTSAAPTITLPASATNVYQVTGTITVATNVSSSGDASYYVQDSTGGINFFVADPTFRPKMGDVVTVSGVLSVFDDNLELEAAKGSATETYNVVSTIFETGTNALAPAPPVNFPLGYAQAHPGATAVNDEGLFVVLTNVYFTQSGNFASETDYTLTNKAGLSYGVDVYTDEGTAAPSTSIIGEPIPAFAYSVAGVLDQYKTTTYELNVTRYSDIVTAPPPPVNNLTAALSGAGNTNITLSWTPVPYRYTYSVWKATNLTGPFAPLAAGLWFTNLNGTFTDAGPVGATRFYKIGSP